MKNQLIAGAVLWAVLFGLAGFHFLQPIEQPELGKVEKTFKEQKIDDIVKERYGTYEARGFTIEIQSVEKIEGGVQVFARAWKDGEPVGFGDGTIEIERFRIFNPPVLVEDPNGTIIEVGEKGNIRKLSRNPAKALKDDLAHTISIVAKDGSNIVPGKVGNTTSTFYSDSGGDGFITASNATWATVRGDTTGTASAGSNDTGSDAPRAIVFAAVYYIGRDFLPFDTSAIPDTDVVSSATLSLYFHSFGGDGDSTTLEVVQTSQASNTSLANADYDNLTFSSGGSLAYPTATAEYKDIVLNATGESWVSLTSFTQLGVISGLDLNNTTPTSISQANHYFSNQAGTTNDPKLVVEHSAPTTNSTNVIKSGGWVIKNNGAIIK